MAERPNRPAGLAAELVDNPRAPVAAALTGRGRVMLTIGILLVAVNLRPVFSSLAAVLPEVRASTAASPATVSLLTTTPVLCLGLFAVMAPRLAARFGTERTILAMLLVLATGTLVRGFGTVPALLGGSMLAGGAIAVVNVLLPGLVKRDFPDRVAAMTGGYTMALSAGAAAAAALTVPLDHALGGSWAAALGLWGVPALAVAVLWLPQALRPKPVDRPTRAAPVAVWRQPLAWQLTGFMGLQSALAYCVFGWLAPLLRARGLDGATAGYVVSFSVMVQTAACLVAPGLATARREQSGFSIVLVALAVVGFTGAIVAPLGTVWVWVALQGAGQGSLVAVALTLIVLRSPDIRTTAAVSSMAQAIGYTIAAFGPLAMGLLFTRANQPIDTLWLVGALGIGIAVSGWFAGRNRVLGEPEHAAP